MFKPGKTFNLSKESKRMLCNILDPHLRGSWKRNMIQAELAEAVVPKREKRTERPGGNYTTNDTGTASTSAD